MSAVPVIQLSKNVAAPVLGLGTYLARRADTFKAVKAAIDIGYRHFDCAYIYGNEVELGQALAEKITEGAIKREDVFITSKLWNTFHSRARDLEAVDVSLKRIGLEYLDLYLIHFPMGYEVRKEVPYGFCIHLSNAAGAEGRDSHSGKYSSVDYLETWKAMEEVQKAGKSRSVGVSNFSIEQLKRILESCSIKPACNQIEVHVYLQNRKLVEFCQENGIAVVAHSPLGGEDAERSSRLLSPLKDPVVKEIAAKHNKDPAHALVTVPSELPRENRLVEVQLPSGPITRFLIQLDLIVIPKSVKKHRLESNFSVWDFVLDESDMDKLRALDKRGRYRATAMTGVSDHPYYPFHADGQNL